MRWRCLFNGMCPVRNWINSDAWRLGSFSASFAKPLEGKDGSISLNRAYLGDVWRMDVVSSAMMLRKVCFIAALLRGSRMGVLSALRRDIGSLGFSEFSPRAAHFACSSAASLPGMPMWPADHRMISLWSSFLGSSRRRSSWNISMR
jgi:hypothetical protein